MAGALSAGGLVPVVACSVGGQKQQALAAAQQESSSSVHHRRRSANYQPCTWDYDAICSLSRPPACAQQAATAAMKERVRRRLLLLLEQVETTKEAEDKNSGTTSGTGSTRLRLLRVIHQLQSLGIAYHFQEEIGAILLSMSMMHHAHAHASSTTNLDLHSAALLFRMLRAHGIPASTDMLVRALREEEDDDKRDSDGLLALYQASYLGFPGEETVLDQARAFAVQNLAGTGRGGGGPEDELPLHWTAPRLQAMRSLQKLEPTSDEDEEEEMEMVVLQQLARADFNQVQALHRRELAGVTRWWKETGLGEKLAFARDRVVECFFCAACIAPEPHLADCREVLAKTGSLIVHLDDIYDVYGAPDELQAFTDAIGKWDDERCVMALPEYMRAMFAAIWETSTTAADRVLIKHGCHVLPLYKKAWHELCKAFLVEARWHQQSRPTSFADYLANGWVTSTGPLLLLHALPAAGAEVTGGVPRMAELSSTIFRLCNDCASHQAESERGDAPSAIACCMAEAWCTGEEQARAAVQGLIADTWKELNEEMSSCAADQRSMAMADMCLNLARVIHCIYQDGDGITSPTHHMKRMVKDLLFNPILF